MAQFIKKIFDHLFNQVLVESLSNARWFQRFAVKSTQMMQELGTAGKGQQGQLGEQASKFYEAAKQQSSKFRTEFETELRNIQQQGSQKGGPPQTGKKDGV